MKPNQAVLMKTTRKEIVKKMMVEGIPMVESISVMLDTLQGRCCVTSGM